MGAKEQAIGVPEVQNEPQEMKFNYRQNVFNKCRLANFASKCSNVLEALLSNILSFW